MGDFALDLPGPIIALIDGIPAPVAQPKARMPRNAENSFLCARSPERAPDALVGRVRKAGTVAPPSCGKCVGYLLALNLLAKYRARNGRLCREAPTIQDDEGASTSGSSLDPHGDEQEG